jgi:hypothetical protein
MNRNWTPPAQKKEQIAFIDAPYLEKPLILLHIGRQTKKQPVGLVHQWLTIMGKDCVRIAWRSASA